MEFRVPGAPLAFTVYNELKKGIVTCTFLPGDSLHEADLAERFSVSKTPVREALNLLRREGLIESFPRHGYRVSGVTVKDVYDVYQLRLMLEPAAGALAAKSMDGGTLEELKSLSRIEYVHGDPESYADFLQANRRFHTLVARATGNQRLAEVVERLLEEMERFFRLGLDASDASGEMVHEHEDLVHAIETGNSEAAEKITREQIEASRKRVIEALGTRPMPGPGHFSATAIHVGYRPPGGEWTLRTVDFGRPADAGPADEGGGDDGGGGKASGPDPD